MAVSNNDHGFSPMVPADPFSCPCGPYPEEGKLPIICSAMAIHDLMYCSCDSSRKQSCRYLYPSIEVLGLEVSFLYHDDECTRPVMLTDASTNVYSGTYLSANNLVHVAIRLYLKETQSFVEVIRQASLLSKVRFAGASVPYCYGIVYFHTNPNSKYVEAGLVMHLIQRFSATPSCTALTLKRLMELHLTALDLPVLCKFMPLTINGWYNVVLQIIRSVQIIHDQGIVLNNLRLEDIGIELTKRLKWKVYILGFSYARPKGTIVPGSKLFSAQGLSHGRQLHMPPEFNAGPYKCAPAGDVYILGWLLEFAGLCLQCKALCDLAADCMVRDPMQRPQLDQLRDAVLYLKKVAKVGKRISRKFWKAKARPQLAP